MNETFNPKRFWWTLRLTAISDMRMASSTLMGATVGLFAMFAVLALVNHFSPIGSGFITLNATMAVVFLAFFIGIMGYSFGTSLKTKKRRTAYLTLPASNMEKFISCYLMSTAGMFLVFLLAMLIADIGRMALVFALGDSIGGSVFATFFKLPSIAMENKEMIAQLFVSTNVVKVMTVSILNVFCIHAFFMCGSVLFHRHTFLMTLLAYFVVSVVEGLLQIDHIGMTRKFVEADFAQSYISICIKLIVLYTATYLLFRRTQVINDKLISL